jgi:hypothetical protein
LLTGAKSVISGTAPLSAACAIALADAVLELAPVAGVDAIGESGIDEPAAASLEGGAGDGALWMPETFAGVARPVEAPAFEAPVAGDGLADVTGVNVVAAG